MKVQRSQDKKKARKVIEMTLLGNVFTPWLTIFFFSLNYNFVLLKFSKFKNDRMLFFLFETGRKIIRCTFSVLGAEVLKLSVCSL